MPESQPVSPEMESLRRTRDELQVQMHLARAELKEEWEKAETKWSRLEGEVHRLRDRAAAPTKELKHAVTELANDIGESYARIVEALRRPA